MTAFATAATAIAIMIVAGIVSGPVVGSAVFHSALIIIGIVPGGIIAAAATMPAAVVAWSVIGSGTVVVRGDVWARVAVPACFGGARRGQECKCEGRRGETRRRGSLSRHRRHD